MRDEGTDPAELVIVGEEICRQVIDRADAFAAVEQVFAAMARGDATNFPVVREAIGHADALYGFKGGFDRAGLALGLKAGGYWPGNAARGLTNHQSTVCLFDPDTGRLSALVAGNHLTALRTAAWVVWAVVVYLGVIMTAVGYAMWYHLLGQYPVYQVAPFLLLLPVTTVLGGVLLLDEALTARLLIGGGLAIGGVAIINLLHRKPRAAGEAD